jgi:TNF receptor-associated protein 1
VISSAIEVLGRSSLSDQGSRKFSYQFLTLRGERVSFCVFVRACLTMMRSISRRQLKASYGVAQITRFHVDLNHRTTSLVRPFSKSPLWLDQDASAPASNGNPTSTSRVPYKSPEKVIGDSEKHTFQAETKQLLNIVTHSLYTDKHIFVRELISNASDALEKLRHRTVSGEPISENETPLEIRISCDDISNTITIADTGIGMSREELIENLGTIARSGSKAFLQKLRARSESASGSSTTSTSSDVGSAIIGQFGVGFYSAFMVAESISVFSQSADPSITQGYCWTSAGDGSYEISQAENVARGSKIVIKLKDSCKEFANENTVKGIIKRYSNFVNFPIMLNQKQVNTVTALWTKSKSDITEDQYVEFYKYKSGDFEAPLYKLHFTSDAPIALKALLFVGQSHEEKFGMGRIKNGIDLYCRKVLIETASGIVPDWLRFVHGVVDSEDIPLNISRENMQDSALMKRLRSVITRRILRFFESEARRDPDEFNNKFFPEFGNFLKEGVVTDAAYSNEIGKLLRFESSANPAGKLTSLDEYISRVPPGQQDIFYLVSPHRGLAESSPYMEAFKSSKENGEADIEVLFLYSTIDDFVMNSLREFGGRKLVTAETANIDPKTLQGIKKEEVDESKKEGSNEKTSSEPSAHESSTPLTEEQISELGSWMVSSLPGKLLKVKSTHRLKSSPAVITDHESAAVRRMLRMVEATAGKDQGGVKHENHLLPPQTLEINPSHPIITSLFEIKATKPALALVVAEQILDNAMIAAGLVDDARSMLPRLNALLEQLLGNSSSYKSSADIEAKRFVSPEEADERAGIQVGQEMFNDLSKELNKLGYGENAEPPAEALKKALDAEKEMK